MFRQLLQLLDLKYEDAKEKLVHAKPDEIAMLQAQAVVMYEMHKEFTRVTPQTPKAGG